MKIVILNRTELNINAAVETESGNSVDLTK